MKSKYLTHNQRTVISVVVKVIIGLLFISPLFIGLIFSFVPDQELLKLPTLQTIRNTASFNNSNASDQLDGILQSAFHCLLSECQNSDSCSR